MPIVAQVIARVGTIQGIEENCVHPNQNRPIGSKADSIHVKYNRPSGEDRSSLERVKREARVAVLPGESVLLGDRESLVVHLIRSCSWNMERMVERIAPIDIALKTAPDWATLKSWVRPKTRCIALNVR